MTEFCVSVEGMDVFCHFGQNLSVVATNRFNSVEELIPVKTLAEIPIYVSNNYSFNVQLTTVEDPENEYLD